MKKFFISVLLTIFCLSLSLSFQTYYFIRPLNTNLVKKNIDYLSSSKFKGRLAGTLENYETTIFIKNTFEENGLKPYKGSYFQSFDTLYPHRVNGKPKLIVKDKTGFLIKDYKYGVDYKEDLLNFKENNISFSDKDILLWRDDNVQVQKGNSYFMFYNPEGDELTFRSSFMSTSPHSMYVIVTKNTINEIKNYVKSGYEISCFIPFEVKETSINNVIGYIEGKNSSLPPIILSAHFDHLGSDLSGNIYAGALDNASGTALMMELSKYLKSLGKPDRDIIFAGFNAEEFGCLGSKAFVEKYKKDLVGGEVINFDMVGSNKSVPLYIMGGKKDTKDTAFIKEFARICEKNKVSFGYLFQDSSDHEHFRFHGIDAVTLSDSDSSKIHTPIDKSDFIDTKLIQRCFNIASKEIIKSGFGSNPYISYYKEISIISLVGIFLCFIKYNRLKN